MRILFVTAELSPFTGSTPTADLCGALPKALKGLGHEVTVVSPLYGFIDPSEHSLARRLRKIEVQVGEGSRVMQVFDSRTAAGVDLLFLAEEELFGPCKQALCGAEPSDEERFDEGMRFGTFSKAVVELCTSADPGFDLIHCHDWPTALVPMLADRAGLSIPTVLSISDADEQGLFSPDLMHALGLPNELFGIDGLEFYGKVCFLKGGAISSSQIIACSPSYAAEMVEEGGASGLEGVLAGRGRDLRGIAGGVDSSIWNPATDPHLEARFDPMDLSGKRRSKAALQLASDFPVRDDVPLIAVLGPLTAESGLDVLPRILGRLMRNEVQLCIAADENADPALASVLREHAKRWPDRLQVLESSTGLRRRMLAGADAVLLPPRQPAGGNLQMRAHRYGALPVGLRSGAFLDTVVDCDAKLDSGTGFAHDDVSDESILSALQRVIAAFDQPRAFARVKARALNVDHSWERCAYLFERAYKSTLS